jgi:hypothetical protein
LSALRKGLFAGSNVPKAGRTDMCALDVLIFIDFCFDFQPRRRPPTQLRSNGPGPGAAVTVLANVRQRIAASVAEELAKRD